MSEKTSILTKIENLFGAGYAAKEDLRDLDKQLRDGYFAEFKGMRKTWEEIYLTALKRGVAGDEFKKVIQVIDRIAEKVHHADYGYAGLFDRTGHIREAELQKILGHDKALEQDIAEIKKAIEGLYADSERQNTDDLAKVRSIKSLILALESKWNRREEILTKGGKD